MATNLPDYVASSKPVPQENRVPWYSSTAPTYAGIMLWFVFWFQVPIGKVLEGDSSGSFSAFAGGTLGQGLGVALLGLVIAALVCHFLFFLVPGLLGMQTGLPLYIVGTSTYGVRGGFLMPGFLMGLLQFGWLAVNAFFAGTLLCAPFGQGPGTPAHAIVASLWAIAAAFMGLKGIQYVAKVATFLPLIPFVILIVLFAKTAGGISSFDAAQLNADYQKLAVVDGAIVMASDGTDIIGTTEDTTNAIAITPQSVLPAWGIIALIGTYIVGFFATAGAAGVDFGMNNRNVNDVHLGGLFGVVGATIFAGGMSLLIVAGAHGAGMLDAPSLNPTGMMATIMGSKTTGAVFMYLLAIAAFPPACFSAFIAANSFKTTLPKVNPIISCGIGTLIAIFLAVTGYAGDAIGVFTVIGASFGPVCGAMMADYLLAGGKWNGPRAGFNPAGWISWICGFIIGAADFIPALAGCVPCPPVAAFLVGLVLYFILSSIGLKTKTLEMPEQ